MITIATLGPENTFSEIAANLYAQRYNPGAQIHLYTTTKRLFSAIGKKCDIGILPIENLLDGYIPQVLDLLLHSRLTIVNEFVVPVQYSFAGRCTDSEKISRLFIPRSTLDQCSDFLETFSTTVSFVVVESNGEAFQNLLKGNDTDGAVVPAHLLDSMEFPLIVKDVGDYIDNKTRFVVVAEQEQEYKKHLSYKTSIVIMEGIDRPGMLSEILAAFASRSINLLSIISRPTKESMGKYHFFIDVEGYARDSVLQDALTEIRRFGFVKLIGSFPKADQLTNEQNSHGKSVRYPDNPWKTGKQSVYSRVTVAHGDDAYKNTLQALASLDTSPIRGKRILLKPNIGRAASPDSGVVTSPLVVAAAIDFFRKAGATFCAVGESPITGVNLAEAFEMSGIAEICRDRNCPLIDMDKRQPCEMSLPNAVALEKITVCADIFEFDIIVSMPVMKMHMHTGVTLSIKNMKGCLWARSKVALHMLPPVPYCDDKSLNVAIADMASVLYPHMSIIDGTIGMEGLGPSAGTPRKLGVVLVSTDALAADTIACELMGVSPQTVPHMRILSERGFGTIDARTISVEPGDWRSYIQPFAALPDNLALQYPNVTILDENSCSACQSTLLMFLKRNGRELSDYIDHNGALTIAIGKGHSEVPVNSLCIGNCTRKFREHTIYVSGCPPVASSIMKMLEK
jgi:prephenate dehydratase/uncharacterized protein (DUF362 family)